MMKRFTHYVESENERLAQEKAAIVLHANLGLAFGEIPDLVYAFRFHPWRLLRLMATSQWLRETIEKVAREWPRLWFDCCLSSFPDLVIALRVYADVATQRGVQRCLDVTETWLEQLAALRSEYDVGKFDAANPMKRLARSRAISCSDGVVDRSFHAADLLDACLRDPEHAHLAARSFRMLCPLGVPPAHYCFLSQLTLHRLALAFIELVFRENLPGNDPGDFDFVASGAVGGIVDGIKRRFTLIPDSLAKGRQEAILPFISIQTCDRIREEQSAAVILLEGAGPRLFIGYNTRVASPKPSSKPGYPGAIFELTDLLALMRTQGASQARRELYQRVAVACLVFAREEAPPLLQIDKDEPLVIDVARERADNMARYGTYDPLYWEVLLQGNEPAFSLVPDWRAALVAVIDVVRRELPGSEEYKRMEAVVPTQMTCEHCGGRAHQIERCAPFGLYCGPECQSSRT